MLGALTIETTSLLQDSLVHVHGPSYGLLDRALSARPSGMLGCFIHDSCSPLLWLSA
jgi:hypothetical protein